MSVLLLIHFWVWKSDTVDDGNSWQNPPFLVGVQNLCLSVAIWRVTISFFEIKYMSVHNNRTMSHVYAFWLNQYKDMHLELRLSFPPSLPLALASVVVPEDGRRSGCKQAGDRRCNGDLYSARPGGCWQYGEGAWRRSEGGVRVFWVNDDDACGHCDPWIARHPWRWLRGSDAAAGRDVACFVAAMTTLWPQLSRKCKLIFKKKCCLMPFHRNSWLASVVRH